jgi:hypothetical protein
MDRCLCKRMVLEGRDRHRSSSTSKKKLGWSEVLVAHGTQDWERRCRRRMEHSIPYDRRSKEDVVRGMEEHQNTLCEKAMT